jgi:hypothetical protein
VSVEDCLACTGLRNFDEELRSVVHIDSRIVGLTLLNALLYWPWHWLRVCYDAGNHRPQLVLIMMALTLWAWWQLLAAILNQINGRLPR